MINEIKTSYRGVRTILRRYWDCYGGWRVLLSSPYFHVSVILTAFLFHYWLNKDWWTVALTVLPNIIGFALGGYAIWLGFGDEEFRRFITEKDDDKESAYVQVSAAFAHFIIMQILAITSALVAQATDYRLESTSWMTLILNGINLSRFAISDYIAPIFYGFGFLLFVYAIMTALAATLAVFRVATWYSDVSNSRALRPMASNHIDGFDSKTESNDLGGERKESPQL